MRRYSLIARRIIVALSCTLVASLAVAAGAQAVVANDAGTNYGVALLPNTSLPGSLQDNWNGACNDPSLAPELTWQTTGLISPLCYHGGSVLQGNESYVLTWDPDRRYWATTRQNVEQFLSDVAASSGGFSSPFAVTPQYTESSNGQIVGRAANTSVFAGGCIDYGNNIGDPSDSGYTCQFGANHPSGAGNSYPANGCPQSGNNVWTGQPNGPISTTPNDVCLTDAQIKTELQAMLPQMGLPGGEVSVSGKQLSPVVDVLLPPGVEVCLDSAGHLCSANSNSASTEAQFCSYHSQVELDSTMVTYVVQPWTAQWGQGVGCDDPAAPNITLPVDQLTLAQQVAQKLVSPLSQANIAALVDPDVVDGWYGVGGTEINDNGCVPLGGTLDNVSINGDTWALQREFNNAGAIETDPNALPCTGTVLLNPAFVVPGPVDVGDTVLFDGSVTASTLMVHNGAYQWNFGDGTTGTGPSVDHQYSNPGNYQVKLTVTDRGGNTSSITQTIQVLGANGQPAPPPASSGSGSGSGSASPSRLQVRLQLLPQSLKAVLRSGISVRVTSNAPANGIATVSITRGSAKKAHIKVGRSQSVRIGLGTVSSVKNGTVTLRLYLSKGMAKKLSRLHEVAMTVRLALVAPGNRSIAIVAAGRY
jgi:PKD domain